MSLPTIGLGSMFTSKKPRHKASRDRVVDTTRSGTSPNLIHYTHDYPSPRCPQTPAPMPSTIVGLGYPAPAFFPYGSGTNSHISATPSQEPEPPEVKILYDFYSPAHTVDDPYLSLLVDSVMGATGSGKSSVCFTFTMLQRELTRDLHGSRSSSISPAALASKLAKAYNPVRMPCRRQKPSISTVVASF